jgi:hypothetical protein
MYLSVYIHIASFLGEGQGESRRELMRGRRDRHMGWRTSYTAPVRVAYCRMLPYADVC